MLIDVHAHLHHCKFDSDRDEVVERAKEAGVKVIINNGLNPSSNRKSLELAKKYDIVKAALGIFPYEILTEELKKKGWNYEVFDVDEELDFIEKNKKKFVAVGEIGLDNYHFKNTLKKQEEVFRKQLELAQKIKKPVIIHSRDAENEVVNILEDYDVTAVLHSFSSLNIKKALDKKCFFSIPVSVVRSEHFQKLVEKLPTNKILTETDSPYLGIKREERNEPFNVKFSIKKIAEIKQLEEEEMERIVYSNYQKLFRR